MSETSEQSFAELSRLRISKTQRRASNGGGWSIFISITAVVVLAAVGAGWWYYRTTGMSIAAVLREPTTDVNLVVIPARAERSDPTVLVTTGKIVSDVKVNVATKVSGQIVELNVEQGDRVEKDQVLARVEDTIYRAQRDESAARVAQNEAAVARADAEVTRSNAAILQAQAEFEYQQRDYDRLEALYNRGQASQLEYLNAKNLYEGATAALDVAKAAAKSAAASAKAARSDLEAARSILRVTQKRFDDCAIRAPISGVILERNAQVGDFLAAEGGIGANANAQLVSIADMDLLRVEVDVSERDVGRLHAGQRARVTPDADKDSYAGRVMWVDPIGDYARATVQVKVRILDPGPSLRVEGSAKVEFLADSDKAPSSAPATVWLPKTAVKLLPDSDEAEVFTVSRNKAVAHKIQVGTRSDKSVEVLGGVRPGMQLICEKVDSLEEGSPVRVVRTIPFGDL